MSRKRGLEIEIKWKADHVSRHDFLEFMMGQIIKPSVKGWGFLTVKGPDHYWKVDDSVITSALKTIDLPQETKDMVIKHLAENIPQNTIRNRISPDYNELTSKARIGERHIAVRREENVRVDLRYSNQHDVEGLLRLVGMKKVVTIIKDCDIYTIQDESGAKIDTVWYETMVDGHKNRSFIEVEIDKVSEEKAMELLKTWQNQLRYHLKLTDDLVSNDSLYEIYTGELYKKV